MSLRRKIGLEIRKIRINLNLVQSDFADKFNETKPEYLRPISQKDVSRWELGRVPISAEMLEHIRAMK